ncbi:MAG: UDP-N-acetylmuramoyl-L-alanine--D-glutamate ligase [Planctomycetota bacterium]|jgi:UDP-N-acetylmuramoylalanine--D-glutamate ligase
MTSLPGAGSVPFCPLADLLRTLAGLRGKRVTLMGLGLFGGGEGAARFLMQQGATLTVTDLRPAEKLAAPLSRLKDLPINYSLGEHASEDFVGADLVVANPAVPRSNSFLHAAHRAGVPIASPMNLFLALCPAPIAAVTGSNGKSTTTALLAAMLRRGRGGVWLGGNIGGSLLPALSRIAPADLVVLELSSFQLEDAAVLGWSPHVAVVTNITPNHLDRHPNLSHYAQAKRQIVRQQGPADFAVLNARDQALRGWARAGLPGQAVYFDSAPQSGALLDGVSLLGDRLLWRSGSRHEVICRRAEVPLPGRHNVENAMAAAAAARCLGTDALQVRQGLCSFVGLEHRLELVGEHDGVRFYNDSYSTTPAAAVAAVESFAGPLTLIAGGYDKKIDLSPLARAAGASVKVFVAMGQTGPRLASAVRRESGRLGRSVLVLEGIRTLEEAVRAAAEVSMPGWSVLFSPGCASYDMFENYEDRGQRFKGLVRRGPGGACRRGVGA